MHKKITMLVGGLVLFGLIQAGMVVGQFQAPVQGGSNSAKENVVREYLQAHTSKQSSGVALLVARDEQVVLALAAGMANIADQVPLQRETRFRIGSVTKQFTALAIARLAEKNQLSLQDTLDKYFPEIPNANLITIEQLIWHTSGLKSYTAAPNFYRRVDKLIQAADLIKEWKTAKPDFAPGTDFSYCNTGYFLLGEIVAKVSKKSYAEFLQQEFFQPLGMLNTGVYDNANPPENDPLGYQVIDNATSPTTDEPQPNAKTQKNQGSAAIDSSAPRYEVALNWDMSWAGAAGALYSTVDDLCRWNQALYGGRVVSAEMLKKVITPNELPPTANGLDYGFGLNISNYRRLPLITHGGGLNGWTCDLAYYPDQKVTIVVLTNASPSVPELTPSVISRMLADLEFKAELAGMPARQVDGSVDPKSFPDFVGKYDYQGEVMTVTVARDKIFSQLTGQPKWEIFPSDKDEFFWKIVEADVRFLRDEQGVVQGAKHTQNGRSFMAPKIASSDLTAADLEVFVGKYRYGLAVMTVSRERDQLFAQLAGQPKFPIFATDQRTFQWRVVEAKVEFLVDGEGKVTAARHSQGGNQFDAPRLGE